LFLTKLRTLTGLSAPPSQPVSGEGRPNPCPSSKLDPVRRNKDHSLINDQLSRVRAYVPVSRYLHSSSRTCDRKDSTPLSGGILLRCGISARPMTAQGHSRRSGWQQGFAGCPLCLQQRPNPCVAAHRRFVPPRRHVRCNRKARRSGRDALSRLAQIPLPDSFRLK
jgi:hypothetical protein